MDKIVVPAPVKGLIFDCDGTIADTMPLHYQAYLQAMGDEGPYFTSELFYGMAGIPAVPVLQILKDRFSLNYDPETVADEKEKIFGTLIHQVTPIEAVEQVVHDYHGRLPMAVASGGTRENVVRTLEVLHLLDKFDYIVSADEVPNGKPEPDIFLEAARLIGVDPKDCLVFEDGDMGIQAARAAGMEYIDVRLLG